jgi:hypothetical protein
MNVRRYVAWIATGFLLAALLPAATAEAKGAGKITACVARKGPAKGLLRLTKKRCKRGEKRVVWTKQGIAGAPGAAGAAGPKGDPGAPGAKGDPGQGADPDELAALQGQVADLQDQLGQLSTRLTAAETQLATALADIAGQSTTISALCSQTSTLTTTVNGLRTTVNGVIGIISALGSPTAPPAALPAFSCP